MPTIYTTRVTQNFRPRDADPLAEEADARRAIELMAQVHAGWLRSTRNTNPGLTAPAVPTAGLDTSQQSLFYVAAITFTGPDGRDLDGYGAAIGLLDDAPTLTVFVSRGDDPVILATPETSVWIQVVGGGELPDPSESPQRRGNEE
ncbi:MAG TPA: hypothetical protein VD997_03175 [Phycisphaerales bacterium]|nr:hypothetical protein [Phycisphaerales bacterium]